MNRQELESLLSESEDYINSRAEVIVKVRKASGEMESKVYQLTGSRPLGFSTIHEPGEGVNEEDMHWVAFAILEEEGGSHRIDRIPLSHVIESIKSDDIVVRRFFDK